MIHPRYCLLVGLSFVIAGVQCSLAQTLEQQLLATEPAELAEAARRAGDAQRGAVVFYQPYLACTRCHIADRQENRLGPDLTKLGRDVTDEHLVDSLLHPSKVIREGFEPITLIAEEGKPVSGILVSDEGNTVVVRDAGQNFKVVTFRKDKLDEFAPSNVSIMPAGQINTLTSRQQFLDLIRYLIEIRDGGASRARELEPAPSLYAARPLPDYEHHIDHAGILAELDQDGYRRGEKIYNRLCINCHGTHDRPGSLPTSLKFAAGTFKNGNDPYRMYQTLTRGFGMMAAQTWMVPTQKYDVIHYIRQAYIKEHNPSQYFEIDQTYLDGLPAGDTRGPAPSNILPWQQMDYGPNLVMTLEVGKDGTNFAYKGNAIRLDAGPGGISQGRYWMVFDYDTLRVAAAWSGEGFCDWKGINFDGQHNIHPRITGRLHLANPTGPGWGRPGDGSFDDDRLVGRDGRFYGPLDRRWAHYKGMYYHGPNTIIHYAVGDTKLLEMPGVITTSSEPVFTRTFNIGPRHQELLLQVAHRAGPNAHWDISDSIAVLDPRDTDNQRRVSSGTGATQFNGGTYVEVAQTAGMNLEKGDFTVAARIKTKTDGTILAHTENGDEWVPNGLSWFISSGRLTADVGWVGEFRGRRRVDDGRWHHVAFTYKSSNGEIGFFVDGTAERRTGRLRREASPDSPVVRIGYTAEDFPDDSFFQGQMAEVRFYNAILPPNQIKALAASKSIDNDSLAAHWDMQESEDDLVRNKRGDQHDGRFVVGSVATTTSEVQGWTVAGVDGEHGGSQWLPENGHLRLRIPSGNTPLRFTLWLANVSQPENVDPLVNSVVIDEPDQDLTTLTHGGPSRWPEVLKTEAIIGSDDGPFAVDVLRRPTDNPWFCRMRLTGFDFTPDGKQAVVSAWEGSIWLVSGLGQLPENAAQAGQHKVQITWRRIASGLFQPLGVKIVDDTIYVTCRDQICILHDLNGDQEIDYFENFNNDHQVTDHFHEFAMGLQADEEGNFYYAKSARHALTALVPHHGTLLRVSKDGLRTDILASGFRAANGVCLNPDGTFIVTDQEGHWNPKNRVNYVKQGGFYGNMFGYHDVTDSSDNAMEQPLCWITNSFDRSPGELLWVDSPRWGPLNRRLLNLSYGYGKVYIVPHEDIGGQQQGGMCEFPIPQFPTGTMRGRFHPGDGQLYVCGMFAWAGSQTQPGGLYRIRYTGKPVHLPTELNATRRGMTIVFSGMLDAESASDAENYSVKVWDLKRTKNYGSDHYNEHSLKVASARLDSDGRTVQLAIPEIAPTWCMEIRYRIRATDGKPINGNIHNTIHNLGG